MNLTALAKLGYEYTESKTGVHIRFLFGNKELTQNPEPTELKPSEDGKKTVQFTEPEIDFTEHGGVLNCKTVIISTTDPVTSVNYRLKDGEKISNIRFIFNISKSSFYEFYINEDDVFKFRDTNVFAFTLDFSGFESVDEDNKTIKFESDGNLITIEFRPEE